MKKLLTLALLLFSLPAFAQQRLGSFSETLSAAGIGTNTVNAGASGAVAYQLNYTTTGTPASLSIQLEGTVDGTTYTACSIALTNVTSGSIACVGTYAKIRANLTVLSGGTAPTVTYTISANASKIGLTVFYSATALGASAVALPANPTEVLLNKVDLTGAKALTLISNCGQIYTIKGKLFAPDGTTALLTNTSTIAATMGASFESTVFISDNSAHLVNGGTVSGAWKLPLSVIQWALLNTTATPTTCTVTMLVTY